MISPKCSISCNTTQRETDQLPASCYLLQICRPDLFSYFLEIFRWYAAFLIESIVSMPEAAPTQPFCGGEERCNQG